VNEYKRELQETKYKYENQDTEKYCEAREKYDEFKRYVEIELSEIEQGRSSYDNLINQVNLRKHYF
jgi:thermostable 8-oxoguanine DNA glycosylase